MANNQDALDAIKDITEAIAEFGSTIYIQTITEGAYDPYNVTIPTPTSVQTKGLPSSEATPKVHEAFKGLDNESSYELSMKLQSDTEITMENRILYDSKEYEIKYISKKVLQDTTLLYEVLLGK